jgi:hypothetical protein
MKVKLNSLITSISGKMGDLVYYQWRGIQCARKHIIPPNPRTVRQQAGRLAFASLCRKWRGLSDIEKREWSLRAKGLNMTGYNAFIKAHIKIETQMILVGYALKKRRRVLLKRTPKLTQSQPISNNPVISKLHIVKSRGLPHARGPTPPFSKSIHNQSSSYSSRSPGHIIRCCA